MKTPDIKMTIDCSCGATLIANAPWIEFPVKFDITCSTCLRKYSLQLDEGNHKPDGNKRKQS